MLPPKCLAAVALGSFVNFLGAARVPPLLRKPGRLVRKARMSYSRAKAIDG